MSRRLTWALAGLVGLLAASLASAEFPDFPICTHGEMQHLPTVSGNVAGETDNAHEWENAEIREGQISEALDELRQTEAALARLDEGKFGVCVICGIPIEAEWLELIPEAVRCEKHA